MESLKSNAEIRNEAVDWVTRVKAGIEADAAGKKVVLGPFLEPWTHSVTIGELIVRELRWRAIAPNRDSRLRCLQVTQFSNLLEWPAVPFAILRVRPDNLFDPPQRTEMLEVLSPHLGGEASVGDVLKIEGGWAVAVSGAGEVPETISGFTVRKLNQEEIAELPAGTQTGKRNVAVASLRIDAVSSKALKPSREQVKKHIESGGVLLNYEPARKPGVELVEDDVVSVRNGGRFRFGGIASATRKGRIQVEVEILNGP